jgi:hypothetical protein
MTTRKRFQFGCVNEPQMAYDRCIKSRPTSPRPDRARRRVLAAVAIVASGVMSIAGTSAAATHARSVAENASVPVSWGTAAPLPGLTALVGPTGTEDPLHLRCFSATRCTAYGMWETQDTVHGGLDPHFFVDDLTNGQWGSPQALPGLSVIGDGLGSSGSLSCVAAGDCVAFGQYTVTNGVGTSSYVATETSGQWAAPMSVPGLDQLNAGQQSRLVVVCVKVGSCVGGGSYKDATGTSRAYLVNETSGTWSNAFEVAGVTGLLKGGSSIDSIRCASLGNCLAVGTNESPRANDVQPFLVEEDAGRWGAARTIPWVTAHNTGRYARVTGAACGAKGTCTLVGYLQDAKGRTRYFFDDEQQWVWGTPSFLPDLPAFLPRASPPFVTIRCNTVAYCTVAGVVSPGVGRNVIFVLQVASNVALAPTMLADPGTQSTTLPAIDYPIGLSCPIVGTCGLLIDYIDPGRGSQWSVGAADEVGGVWSSPQVLPGTVPGQFANASSVTCPTASTCVATGLIPGGNGEIDFVTN